MNRLFGDIVVFCVSLSVIKSSGFDLSMRKRVHVHHSIGGLLLGSTIATLVILFGFLEHGHADVDDGAAGVARAALDFGPASRIFTDELAFRFGTLRLDTLPVAFGLFADGLAFGLGHLAVGHTMRLFANSHTFGAVVHLARFVRAHYLAVRLLTFHVAHCVLRLLARSSFR